MSDEVENVNEEEMVMFNDSNIGGTLPRYSAKQNLHRATFFCDAPEARGVALIGDFNNWNPFANPMVRQPDGRWMASVELTHGYHEYLFLVDGTPGHQLINRTMNASTHNSIPLLLSRSLARDQRISQERASKHKQFKRADTLRSPLVPRLHSEVRMLANTPCAAFGGAGPMTLAEWRDVEEQLKRKLAYEKCKTHQ